MLIIPGVVLKQLWLEQIVLCSQKRMWLWEGEGGFKEEEDM
jgi:hypothetical protein